MASVNIKVYGLVQGVFFRKSAKIEAEKLGISGWVRNLGDGSVEIMATGQKQILENLISWCKKGPPLADVNKVEINWLGEEEDFAGFEIL